MGGWEVFGLWRWQQYVVTREMEFGHATIEMDARISIGGCIDALFLVENFCLPVAQLRVLRDALAEEVSPKFLKTEILNAHTGGKMLEINEAGRVKGSAMREHPEIVVERETDLENGRIFKQINEASWESHEIKTEEEANLVVGNLKKRYKIVDATLERRTGLSVDA